MSKLNFASNTFKHEYDDVWRPTEEEHIAVFDLTHRFKVFGHEMPLTKVVMEQKQVCKPKIDGTKTGL